MRIKRRTEIMFWLERIIFGFCQGRSRLGPTGVVHYAEDAQEARTPAGAKRPHIADVLIGKGRFCFLSRPQATGYRRRSCATSRITRNREHRQAPPKKDPFPLASSAGRSEFWSLARPQPTGNRRRSLLRRGRPGGENAGRGQKAPLPAVDYQPHVR